MATVVNWSNSCSFFLSFVAIFRLPRQLFLFDCYILLYRPSDYQSSWLFPVSILATFRLPRQLFFIVAVLRIDFQTTEVADSYHIDLSDLQAAKQLVCFSYRRSYVSTFRLPR